MNNLDFSQIKLERLITHYVGNKSDEENLQLSKELTNFREDTLEYLLKYFLSRFKPVDIYNFYHSVDLELNEVYSRVKKIFKNESGFIEESKNLATLLYEHSTHPNIKQGELNIVYFCDVIVEDEIVDAIGIFKSETDSPFLKMKGSSISFSIEHEFGYDLKGIDKGCIIFNTDQAAGYHLLIVDNTNTAAEAKFWKDDFLGVIPHKDDYFKTKHFLGMTKKFVKSQLPEEFDKPDKIDMLNRSVKYFSEKSQFDKNEFEAEVFKDPQVIDSFRKFKKEYHDEDDIDYSANFDISPQAVKQQSRSFKSVLKLDNNFHLYIHGDRNMIEQGIDKDGRKYYKIYYQEEK